MSYTYKVSKVQPNKEPKPKFDMPKNTPEKNPNTFQFNNYSEEVILTEDQYQIKMAYEERLNFKKVQNSVKLIIS